MLPRSIYIQILVFLCLICVSTVVLKPVHTAFSRMMLQIRTNLIERIEDYIGMEIRYSSIRPTFFGSIDIRSLKFIKDENAFFSVNRARFYFSLPELLFKKKIAVHTIQVERPVLRIDYEKDRDTLDFFSSLLKNNNERNTEFLQQMAEFLPEQAEYRIRNCFFYFSGRETLISAQEMNVDFRWDGGKIILNGRLNAEVTHSGLFDRTLIVKSGVNINGEYLPDLREGSADLLFLSMACVEQDVKRRAASFLLPASNSNTRTLFTLHPAGIDITFNEKKINLSMPPDTPSNFNVNYDFETGGIDAQVNLNRFILNNHASFSDYWKNFSDLFSIPITGTSFFKYEKKALQYMVDFQGGDFLSAFRSGYSSISNAFVISAYGDKERVVVDDFRLSISKTDYLQGIVNFSGSMGFVPFRPFGIISVDHLRFSGRESISASFNISSNAREINISGDKISFGRATFLNPQIFLHPSDRYIGITAAAAAEDGTVYLDAILNKNPLQLEATLSLDSLSVVDIAGAIRPFADFFSIPFYGIDYIRDISLNTEIFFTTDFKNIVYNAPNTVLKISNNEWLFSLSGTDRQVTLSEGLLLINENELLVSAQFNFSNQMEQVFFLDVKYLDMSWYIEGQVLDRTTLIIRDPNGLHVYGFVSNSGSMSGYIECVDFPLPVNDHLAYLNLYMTLRYDTFDFWYFDAAHFEIRDLKSVNGTNYFKISGAADQDGASFREIIYSDSSGMLTGGANFTWDHDFSYLQFLIDMTDGRQTGEYYHLEGVAKDSHININTSVSQMRLERFVSGSYPILISANAVLSWDSIDSFNAQINLSSLNAMVQEVAISASGGASLSNDELLLQNLTFDFAGVKSTLPLVQVNRTSGIAKAGASIQGHTNKWIEGKADLNANFAGIDSWFEIKKALNSINGTLRIANIQYGNLWRDEFVFVFSNNNGAISVSGGEKNMLRLEMDVDGNFFAGLSSPVPIQGTVIGTFKNGIIDGHCNNFFIDLQALWELVSRVDDINIAGGYVTGKLDIRGPVLNPEFFGTGRGSSLRLQVPKYITQDIRPSPFSVVAEGYEITYGPVSAIVGSGSGSVSGWFRFENWVPKNIGLDITVPRETPIPYNIDIAGFLADGNASGKLDMLFDINNSVMGITGVLYSNNTEMGFNMNEARRSSDTSVFSNVKMNSVVNISITTGSMVEFVWPNKASPIIRANPEMGTVILISADTQTGQFSLTSDVKVRSGELYYFDRSFYIREARMFFRENETQFAPRLSARAEIRDRSNTGPVTISMIVENAPLFSFVPRFEASPSLTQLEIYSILGQNLNTVQGNQNADMSQRFLLTSTTDLVTQFVASSDVFSQFVFLRQFERQMRNFLHLDMFNVRTRILQNAVASGVMGLGQQAPVDRNSHIGNYFDNTSVFIGKYIGRDMFIQGMLAMKYDKNSSLLGGIRFEPDIGFEFQTPFFNIRWDFYPFYHPENWWVNDNSITLSWSKSF